MKFPVTIQEGNTTVTFTDPENGTFASGAKCVSSLADLMVRVGSGKAVIVEAPKPAPTRPEHVLNIFLAAWLEWAENGAPVHPDFDREWGLCNNLGHWADRHVMVEFRGIVRQELAHRLKHNYYPFDHTRGNYEGNVGIHHINPRRLAWVRKQLGCK